MAESTPMVHDIHGPSSHPALVLCPAYKSSGGSIHTEKGTWKHGLIYDLWTKEILPEDLNDFVGVKVPYPDEDGKEQIYVTTRDDVNHVEDAYRQLNETYLWLLREHPDESFEDRSEIFQPIPKLGIKGGTPDVLFVGEHVIMDLDFKFGQKTVKPWTEQNKSYLTGVIAENPFRKFTHIYSGIIQPTVRPDKAWVIELSLVELEKHESMMKEIIACAKGDNPPRMANPYCRYCDEFTSCATMVATVNNRMETAKNHVDLPAMTTKDLGKFIDLLVELKTLAGAAEEEMFLRLKNGDEDENYFLGETRGSRVWTSWDEAQQVLGSILDEKEIDRTEMYDLKERSPAQMEKVVGKAKKVREAMAVVTTKTKGRLKLERRK